MGNKFYVQVATISENSRNFWIAKIFNEDHEYLKEFIDSDKKFTEMKAELWIESRLANTPVPI